MKRIYHHYNKWEDFHHGMYEEDKTGREIRVKLAAYILGNAGICKRAMLMVIENWKTATEFNLSNTWINRRAWLGQAACSIYAGVHEDETREAWGKLSSEKRTQANDIATAVIKEWLSKYDDGQDAETPARDEWSEMY